MKEKRYINEIRSVEGEGENSRRVVGYALLFNVRSRQLGDFVETIDPHALDGVIEKSDVVCLYDHNPQRGVLARSKYGQGSLTLTIDEKGLRYEFESPHTALGDELLEGIKRGDISNSSFSFTTAEDHWEQLQDGTYHRTILRIEQLFDVSPVVFPAYDETTVTADMRGLEQLKKEIESRMTKDETKPAEDEVKDEETKPAETEPQNEEKPAEEPASDDTEKDEQRNDEEAEAEDKDKENEPADAPKDDEEVKEDEQPQDKEENRNNIAMNKKFSLIGAINSIAKNQPLDETAQNVIKEGRSAATAAGVEYNGQIVLPLEHRADPVTPNGIMATEATFGHEAVPTDTFDIVGALRDKMVLTQAGAQMINAQGNIEIPVYEGSNVAWADSEIAPAADGSGKFKSVKLTAKRLTAVLPVSKQFLIQTSATAEAMLRADLINAVAEKLQQTILGDEEGDTNKPQGLFYGVTADAAAITYADIVNDIATLEDANIGEYKYVMNPQAKAALRVASLDKGSGKFIYENDAVLGVDALSTASTVSKGVIVGDWANCVIASFGSLDITVDPYSAASRGQVILTVNAYFDYAVKRPEAFVKRILK